MKKIILTLPSGDYLVAFSTSLRSYLQSIGDVIDIINAMSYVDNDSIMKASVYHSGHNKEVTYTAVDIVENEKVWFKL